MARTRRAYLALVGGGATALAGCSSLRRLRDGSGSTTGAADWPLIAGTPGNTGVSAGSGPDPDAGEDWTAGLGNGRVNVALYPPAVGPNRVYTVGKRQDYSASPPEFDLTAMAFDRETGERQWTHALFAESGAENVGHVRGYTYCFAAGRLFVVRIVGDDYRVSAHDPADGSVEWDRSVGTGSGFPRPPIATDDTIYVTAAGGFVALATEDGSTRWEVDRGIPVSFVPAVGDSRLVYVDSRRDGTELVALDVADGSEVWTTDLPRSVRGVPTVAGGTVYLADGELFTAAMSRKGGFDPPRSIYAYDLEDGRERWSRPIVPADLDVEYGGVGTVTATEDRVYYGVGFSGPGPQLSPEEHERILQSHYDGPGVFALSADDGSIEWSAEVSEKWPTVYAPPVFDGSRLYVSNKDRNREPRVSVIDAATGDVEGSFRAPGTGGRCFGVADGTLFVHRTGEVAAYR